MTTESEVVMNALWNQGVSEIQLESHELVPDTAVTVERGEWTFYGKDRTVLDRGKYE